MDINTVSTTKTFPRYNGSIDLKSKISPSGSRVYGNIPVIKLSESKVDAELNPPSFLDPKWNEVTDTPKPVLGSTFWLENPNYLFQTFDLFPEPEMNDAERLNAMTRIVIIISAIMFLFQFQLWWLFLLLGLLVVIALWQLVKDRENIYFESLRRQREYLRPRTIVKPMNPIIHPTKSSLNIIARIN